MYDLTSFTDLEFDSEAEAALRELLGRVDVMRDPQARVVEIVESASTDRPGVIA